jgi:hypothetical protein
MNQTRLPVVVDMGARTPRLTAKAVRNNASARWLNQLNKKLLLTKLN